MDILWWFLGELLGEIIHFARQKKRLARLEEYYICHHHQDFLITVNQDSLMLEAFGSCLPHGCVGKKFIESVLDQEKEHN